MLNPSARICLIVIGASLGAAGCAEIPQPCAPGLMRNLRADLFFGRAIGGRTMVSDESWRQFLDDEITPRFPAGFSVADINGQSRAADGTLVREASKDLAIVLPAGDGSEARLAAVRDAYKRRFDQESVLLVESPVCAAF